MADVEFKPCFVPNRYPDRVARAAVLYPLYGMANSTAEVTSSVMKLIKTWRKRAAALIRNEWYPTAAWDNASLTGTDLLLTYVRNCRPAFIGCVPKMRPCRLVGICPFCYARKVQEVWQRLDIAFPNPRSPTEGRPLRVADAVSIDEGVHEGTPDTHHGRALRELDLGTAENLPEQDTRTAEDFPFHLIERRYTFLKPLRPDDTYPSRYPRERVLFLRTLLQEWIAGRKQFIRELGVEGAFVQFHATAHTKQWRFTVRQIFMVRADWSPLDRTALLLPTDDDNTKVVKCERPTRQEIAAAVVRACRYQKSWLTGDPELTAVYLNARRGLRMTAMFGCFRRRSHR